jgi:hypothetical protein
MPSTKPKYTSITSQSIQVSVTRGPQCAIVVRIAGFGLRIPAGLRDGAARLDSRTIRRGGMITRITTKPGKLFVTFFDEPRAPFPLPAFRNPVKRVFQLWDDAPVNDTSENGRTVLDVKRPIIDPMATVILVEFEGDRIQNSRALSHADCACRMASTRTP